MVLRSLSLRDLRPLGLWACVVLAILLVLAPSGARASQPCLKLPTVSPLSGLTLVNDVNASVAGLSSLYQGASAPTTSATCLTSLAGLLWHDTSTNTLKVRDQADTTWITLGTFDETNKGFAPAWYVYQHAAGDSGAVNAYVGNVSPAWSSYASHAYDYILFHPANTNTGASTLNLNSLGAQSILRQDGSTLQSGDIIGGGWYFLVEEGSYFQLLNRVATSAVTIPAQFSGLKISAPGGGKTATIAANAVSLTDSSGNGWRAAGVSVTLNLATSGAGGLDAGSVANNTWYAVYLIDDGGVAKALASTSATAPTLPSGDVFSARIGWVRTDSSGNILGFTQAGRWVQYRDTGSGLPRMAVGSAGTESGSGNTAAAIAVGGFVPSTASQIRVTTFNYVSGGQTLNIGPNASSLGAYNADPSAGGYNGFLVNRGGAQGVMGDILLESTNIYWVSGSSANAVYCVGWEDNL